MIFKLLDAYEEIMKNEDAFFEKLKALNKKQKGFLFILASMSVILMLLCFWGKEIVLSIYMFFYFVVLLCMFGVIEKDRKQHHRENMKKYNERLEKLENILLDEEYSIDSKDKMKSIINQIDKYLEEIDATEAKTQEGNSQFFTDVIVPIMAFILGAYVQELDNVQVANYAMIFVVLIIPLRYGLKFAKEVCREIVNPTPAKMRHFQEELEDLYIRKYVQ